MLDFVLDLVLGLAFRAVFLPASLLISTPVIVISSLHGEGSYLEKMRGKYARVYDLWRNHWTEKQKRY